MEPDSGHGRSERVIVTSDSEVAVRAGVVFKEGMVAVSCHGEDGVGNTAYMTPDEARNFAHYLLCAANDAEGRNGVC